MKKLCPCGLGLRWRSLGWLAAWLSFALPMRAATLADFGYQVQRTPSQWKVLLVLANFTDNPQAPSQTQFDQNFFGAPNLPIAPSVAGYFSEVSHGRFQWVRAGTVLLNLPASERYSHYKAGANGNEGVALPKYFYNIIDKALATGQVNLNNYDANGDPGVDQSELEIVVLLPDEEPFTRVSLSGVTQASSGLAWQGTVLAMHFTTTLATLCHELAHDLGTIDLYGRWDKGDVNCSPCTQCINDRLSLMSCTGPVSVYLDPWHKMRLGWCEPRIASLRTGGLESLPAAQLNEVHSPLLLYDPAIGPEEFFLLEYRTAIFAGGTVYDSDVAGNGLVIWHVQQDAAKNVRWLADAAVAWAFEENWWFCKKCNSLYYQSEAPGPCAAGGLHEHLGFGSGGDYRMPMNNTTVAGEHGWRWCPKCQGLFFGANQSVSHCPAGGDHDGAGSPDYSCPVNSLSPQYPPRDPSWHRCLLCQSLFSTTKTNGPLAAGICSAPGAAKHDGAPGVSYDLPHRSDWWTVAAEGAPNLMYAGNTVWAGGTTTPQLSWYNSIKTLTSVVVHPFSPGANSITVEWLTAQDTWVDFFYPDFSGVGTFEKPFKTLAGGLAAVPRGGILHLKTGHSPATARITVPMRLEAYGGAATIGR